jgi:hypothetical protein
MKKAPLIILLGLLLMSCNSRTKNASSAEGKMQTIPEANRQPEMIVDLNNENAWDQVRKKAEILKSGLNSEKNLFNLPNDFLIFADKFITDSLFQKQHIDFKYYIGVIGECDTTIVLNSTNSLYSDWNFIKEFSEGTKTEPADRWDNIIYYSNDRVYFEFTLKEIGKIYQIGFEKVNGVWINTLHAINVC